MIRLLKYDWRRNMTYLLSAFVLFVLGELAVEWFVSNSDAAVSLMIIGYAAMLVFIVVSAVKTYVKNIGSSGRRMLPVTSLQHILSPLVMGLAGTLVIGLLFVLHFSMSTTFQHYTEFDQVSSLDPGSVVLLGLSGLESMMFELLLFFLAYTIGRSLRVKFKAVIIVAAYLVLQNGLLLIEDALKLDNLGLNSSEFFSMKLVSASTVFELICSLVMIVVMVKLIDKRVEV
ncbi:hypothetical protein [Paenibacillus pinistramenti]|uniref:hypothetical protein n=1 Tax=Paenibacillus pinistramenti TaxID=1768003 RepID=UPI001107C88B|nr:hypothetical protein [Paenibacillus pinistramenti]